MQLKQIMQIKLGSGPAGCHVQPAKMIWQKRRLAWGPAHYGLGPAAHDMAWITYRHVLWGDRGGRAIVGQS